MAFHFLSFINSMFWGLETLFGLLESSSGEVRFTTCNRTRFIPCKQPAQYFNNLVLFLIVGVTYTTYEQPSTGEINADDIFISHD